MRHAPRRSRDPCRHTRRFCRVAQITRPDYESFASRGPAAEKHEEAKELYLKAIEYLMTAIK
eukprot:7382474-Prymnesium_polylepis.2